MAALQLQGLAKRFGDSAVVQGVDLEVRDGEFMVLVGPSGCGKSTTLRMVAGLEAPSEGRIFIAGRDVTEAEPARRGVAMVFQSYALYPHMTVAENIGFGLRMAGQPRAEVQRAVQRAAESLQLESLLQRRPRELSGGQRQRVAIGRAIVREPDVFLFDEPLSNLDAALRTQMRLELSRLHERLRATVVYVTHDQVEAMTLGQRIAVFHQGRIEQVGTPLQLYRRPATRFVAGFLGSPRINLLPAALLPWQPPVDAAVEMGVRPEHWLLGPADTQAGLPAEVELVEHLGDVVLVHCRVPGHAPPVTVKAAPAGLRVARHERVRLLPDAAQAMWFDAQGRALQA